MALWLERPRLRWVPLAVAVGLRRLPARDDARTRSRTSRTRDALGLAIAQMSNRNLAFTDDGVQWALIVDARRRRRACSLAPRLLRGTRRARRHRRSSSPPPRSSSPGRSPARSRRRSTRTTRASSSRKNFPRPLSWLDEITGGEPALYLGQNIEPGAALGIWLTEFWNRSLKYVWSIDGTAPGPGPVLTPDLVAADGRLTPDPGARYVVAEPGIDLDGTVVAQPPQSGRWTVYRLDGPLRLAHARPASSPTAGWVRESAYNQYATQNGAARQRPRLASSRQTWGGPDKPGPRPDQSRHARQGAPTSSRTSAASRRARRWIDPQRLARRRSSCRRRGRRSASR